MDDKPICGACEHWEIKTQYAYSYEVQIMIRAKCTLWADYSWHDGGCSRFKLWEEK